MSLVKLRVVIQDLPEAQQSICKDWHSVFIKAREGRTPTFASIRAVMAEQDEQVVERLIALGHRDIALVDADILASEVDGCSTYSQRFIVQSKCFATCLSPNKKCSSHYEPLACPCRP